jgi:hypothetical protein
LFQAIHSRGFHGCRRMRWPTLPIIQQFSVHASTCRRASSASGLVHIASKAFSLILPKG